MSRPLHDLRGTIEIKDFTSLSVNELKPLPLFIHHKTVISTPTGPVYVYNLDDDGQQVLLVMYSKGKDPLILFLHQIDMLPAQSLAGWKASYDWIFGNPDETDLGALFPVHEVTGPDGRVYGRVYPAVIAGESPTNPPTAKPLWALKEGESAQQGQNHGVLQSNNPGLAGQKLYGVLSIWESKDTILNDQWIFTFNVTNLDAPETGGLMTFFMGRRITNHEIA